MKLIDKFDNAVVSVSKFFVPVQENLKVSEEFLARKKMVAVIPTYKPKQMTYSLVKRFLKYHPGMIIVVVDDCTPKYSRNYATIKKIKGLAYHNEDVVYLRTPSNKLKAGALNFGLDYISTINKDVPEVIVTLDDDIRINRHTIPNLVKTLYSDVNMGAACTIAKVRNKNVNLLTRLQALEYHNFNVSKISDNGFLSGPLVMQGMLTAFRYSALKDVVKFTTGHLIEDYDLTAKLKTRGWKVSISKTSEAWTDVPETLPALWKQRVRWTLGGLTVLKDYWRSSRVVFQDLFGHVMFISLFVFVALSLLYAGDYTGDPVLVFAITVMSLVNFMAANSFNILTFLSFREKDRLDWIIKLTIVAEFAYSNFLTLILFGSYLYFMFNAVIGTAAGKIKLLDKLYRSGLAAFSKVGYSYTWGTKEVIIQ